MTDEVMIEAVAQQQLFGGIPRHAVSSLVRRGSLRVLKTCKSTVCRREVIFLFDGALLLQSPTQTRGGILRVLTSRSLLGTTPAALQLGDDRFTPLRIVALKTSTLWAIPVAAFQRFATKYELWRPMLIRTAALIESLTKRIAQRQPTPAEQLAAFIVLASENQCDASANWFLNTIGVKDGKGKHQAWKSIERFGVLRERGRARLVEPMLTTLNRLRSFAEPAISIWSPYAQHAAE